MIQRFFESVYAAAQRRLNGTSNIDPTQSLGSYREIDPKLNADTTPPDDEYIDLHCIWAVEFYTPGNIDSLTESLEKLGWRNTDPIPGHSDLIVWLHGLRRHQQNQSWMNLDLIVDEHDDRPLFPHRTASLPRNVEYARAKLLSISPSLLALVICFVLKEGPSTSAILDTTLRKYFRTLAVRTKNGWSFRDPMNQKAQHIAKARARVDGLAADWFQENLPGLFSSGLLGGEVPTCSLITLRKADPYPRRIDGGPIPPKYLWLMGMDADFDSWNSKDIDGLKARLPTERLGQARYQMEMVANDARLSRTITNSWREESRRSTIAYVDMDVSSLIGMWAICPMLEGYTRHINEVIQSAMLRGTDDDQATQTLETFRNHIAFSIDMVTVAKDLKDLASDKWPIWFDIAKFVQSHRTRPDEEIELTEELKHVIGTHASWIGDRDSTIRAHLAQYGALVGATENVRLQQRISRLTWVLVFLALATVVASALGSWLWSCIGW